MPPKQRYTREEVIATALDIARKDGLSTVTARDLGKRLGCSSSPVFTAFRNMDEVISETVKAARELYNDYIEKPSYEFHILSCFPANSRISACAFSIFIRAFSLFVALSRLVL